MRSALCRAVAFAWDGKESGDVGVNLCTMSVVMLTISGIASTSRLPVNGARLSSLALARTLIC